MAGEHPNFTTQAKVVATAHYQREWKRARSAIRRAIPGARLVRTGFTGVFVLEADGDCLEIAERLTRECSAYIGHATAVLAEEPSEEERLRAAAVRIGLEHVRPEESFCFRLRKRGSHALRQTTPRLEFELGSAIWDALQQRYGRRPKVDLKNPDVLVFAEVLGPVTALGIVRKDWTEPSVVPVETEMREGSRESPVR